MNVESLLMKCRECGEPIYLAWLEARSKWWPVNPTPDPEGSVGLALREETGRRPKVIGVAYTRKELTEMGPIIAGGLKLRVPHFRTCTGPRAVDSRARWQERQQARRETRRR